MNKSENLILRIDPELKQIIDAKAIEFDISTSKLVRDILSIIYLDEYENLKLTNQILENLKSNKTNLERVIDQTSMKLDNSNISEIHKQSKEHLESCIELLNSIQSSKNR